MAEINNDEKRIGVSGEQIEEAVGKVPTIEADVKANKQSISALQDDVSKHTEDIAKNTADIALKANAEEVYSREETDNAITAKVAEIVAGAPEEFDTLKEMSDWLTEHSDSAATMNSAIQANTKAIADNAKAIEGNTADIEQNKSDILKAESEIEYNKIKWGRVLASGLPSGTAGWYKIASCEFPVVENGTARNATFLVTHHSGTWGILKAHIIANLANVSKFVITSITQGINTKNIIGIAKREGNAQKCEIWCKCTYAGEYYRFVILDNGSSGIPNNYNGFWQMNVTTAYQTNEPSDYDNKAETTDVIKDLSDRVTALETAAGITSE